ncbi:uncharacterized protein KD926_003943 [Aspergillus affinis]|uniref:uncharacterized protein n=1 Tax=Aspergillus affinis TaxID=1070780 RepID=UPI0022FE4FF3|nr:uncharacterized protein KD926_003943 [Aspergillus affinis]KAI9046105.1 hypothetical protein KD926_003943 [Aspergillus affinis]
MAPRQCRHYAGRSSDYDETASSVSFRMDSDDEASADSETDVTDPDVRSSPRRKGKGRPCRRNTSKQTSPGRKPRGLQRPPSPSSMGTDSDSSSDDADEETSPPRHPGQQRSQKQCRKSTAVSGSERSRDVDSGTSPSDDDSCDDDSCNDSDTDPDVDSDNDTSSDSEDDCYADGTRNMIMRMDDRWERYCRKRNKKYRSLPDSKWADPVTALRAAGKRDLTLFFPNDLGIRQSIRNTVRRKGLDTEENDKTPMFIEDVVPLQETTLRTTEKRFYIGLQRMQQCLYHLMACFTVNRIDAMRFVGGG